MRAEFLDRPTLVQWKRHSTALRYEQRLADAPHYRLKLLGLLILAIALLIGTILVSIWLGR